MCERIPAPCYYTPPTHDDKRENSLDDGASREFALSQISRAVRRVFTSLEPGKGPEAE